MSCRPATTAWSPSPTRSPASCSPAYEARHALADCPLASSRFRARLATELTRHTDRLDALVCCAGILSTVPEWIEEGLERNFVLNYLSRYLLVRRLLPWLIDSLAVRLVLVANAGRYRDSLDFDDLQHRRGRPGMRVAGRTQFANDLLATELHARLQCTDVEVSCVFPGVTNSSVFRNARGLPRLVRDLALRLSALLALSPEEAADTPVFLAQDLPATGAGGRFYGPHRKQRAIPYRAQRPERRIQLWHASEGLVETYMR